MTEKLESTATLLVKVHAGDKVARERLCETYLPLLTRWAHGRLPQYARDLAETDDLVQMSLIKALDSLGSFTPRHEGAFLAYLRKILLNNIRMEIRKFSRQSVKTKIIHGIEIKDSESSLMEQAIGAELLEKYEKALTLMSKESREAVILRVEFGFSYPEIAQAMNRPSANAARMTVSRALLDLSEKM